MRVNACECVLRKGVHVRGWGCVRSSTFLLNCSDCSQKSSSNPSSSKTALLDGSVGWSTNSVSAQGNQDLDCLRQRRLQFLCSHTQLRRKSLDYKCSNINCILRYIGVKRET